MNWSEFDFRRLADLSGRVAVVTGGAGVLGEGFAHGLVEHGADVVVADIDAARAEALVEALARRARASRGAGRASAIATDVADEAAVERLVAHTVEAFGSVDILINNAAAPVAEPSAFFSPFEEFALEEWRRQMSVTLDGTFLVARGAGRRMIEQGRGGAIVQIASIYGVVSSDERIYEGAFYRGNAINNPPSYSTGKAGVIGMTRWLATNWSKHGIRVNAIAPGGVFSGENDAFTQRYGARVPMGRMAHRHEIVGGMLYLVSDASSYVTGQCLVIDGGLSAW